MNISHLKALAAGLLLMGSAAASAQETPDAVRLTYADGEVTEILLEKTPKCTFGDNELTVAAEDATFVFSLEEGAVTATFVTAGNSGTQTIADTRKVSISPTSYGIEIKGLRPGSSVAAYDITGRRTAGTSVSSDGTASLQLPAGISVISTEDKSFKIIRK